MDTNKNISNLASDMEGNMVGFETVANMFLILTELLEDDIAALSKSNCVFTQHFVKRFGVMHSQIDAIDLVLHNELKNMQANIDKCYSMARNEKEQA